MTLGNENKMSQTLQSKYMHALMQAQETLVDVCVALIVLFKGRCTLPDFLSADEKPSLTV